MQNRISSGLNILQVSTCDIGGGAAKVAWELFQAYRKHGYASWLAVGYKKSDDSDVLEIRRPHLLTHWPRPLWMLHGRLRSLVVGLFSVGRLSYLERIMARAWAGLENEMGLEDFNHPDSRRLLSLPPLYPDLIHAHNLHGGYFDLRFLPRLSRQVPLVITMHDMWLMSGHCSYSLECERWKTGCGQCPDLTIYPAIKRDATTYNWQRKRKIYAKSRAYVATPSRWLMQKVNQSMLAPALVETRIIPNGVDHSIFHPADRRVVRAMLGIPQDARVILFTANGIRRNRFKDYPTMQAAVSLVTKRLGDRSVLFIALGEDAPAEPIGEATIRFVPYEKDPKIVARYYQAADIYVHAARAEVWGLVITESLSCGTPVVATSVGGIPEQVEDGCTGFLVPPGNGEAIADACIKLLTDNSLRIRLGRAAAEDSRKRFSLDRQVDDYTSWYHEILNNWQSWHKPGQERSL